MRVVVESTYDNCDDEWIKWWLDRLNNEEVMPGCQKVIKDIKNLGYAKFTSKDPTGPVVATTTYLITDD